MSKVLVINSSLRTHSNSDILSKKMTEGIKESGHVVEVVSLKDKEIKFCIGCLSCQKTEKCIFNDDASKIREKVKEADTLVFVTPIYYYEMSGQLKTLLDRMNPLYVSDYKFRRIYALTCATEDEEYVPQKAISGMQGWVDCFEKAEFVDSLFCGGISDPGQAQKKKTELNEAYEFGKKIK